MSYAATCNIGGAGKWLEEYSPYLAGKKVFVFQDTDDPGRQHAQQVCASVTKFAQAVHLVELPGLAEHGDVSDYLETHSPSELFTLMKAAPVWTPPIGAPQQPTTPGNGLKLVGLGDLLSRPVVPVDYLLAGRLVAGSVSIIVSKPKCGKSTFARNLALAVARGEPFLGWQVKQGSVVYLALEERAEDVVADFRAMGATGSEDIQIAEAGTVRDVETILNDKKPALLVVDPLFRLVRVQDGNAYAELYSALGPLIDIARETGTHILCLHHSSKMAKAEAIDAPIGSTALGGAVSTLMVMRRTESYRMLQTVQRIGPNLPETVLRFDPVTRRLDVRGPREDFKVTNIGGSILKALADKSMTEPEIDDAIEGKTTLKRKALRELMRQGWISRSGSGKRGDPYLYENACSLVPNPMERTGNEKPGEGVPEGPSGDEEKVVPVIRNTYGNKETRICFPTEDHINTKEKVVPANAGASVNSQTLGTSNRETNAALSGMVHNEEADWI